MDDSKKIITLICSDSCCPEVIVDKKEVVIKDDFGGKVKLTKKEFDLLKEKVKNNEL